MAYDKPKVTIDLEEYSKLRANAVYNDHRLMLAKTAIAIILNNNHNLQKAVPDFEKANIRLAFPGPTALKGERLTGEDITLEPFYK